MDYASLLSGATGSLGLGGVSSSPETGPSASATTTVSPTVAGITGGGVNFSGPNVQVTFPSKPRPGTDINEAIGSEAGQNALQYGLYAAAAILLIMLIRR